jgi:hypothetical protein
MSFNFRKFSFIFSLAIALMLTLTACHSDGDLDFRSVLDTETGVILALGDAQADFADVYGEGTVPEGAISHVVHYGDLAVFFDTDGYAIEIAAMNLSNRFEFQHVSFDLTDETLNSEFVNTLEGLQVNAYSYQKFFDDNGNEVASSDDASYFSGIAFLGEQPLRITIGKYTH